MNLLERLNQRMAEKLTLPAADACLPGRAEPLPTANQHFVLKHRIQPPFPDGLEQVIFGLGCFWGAERKFWQLRGVYSTAVGYSGGHTPNPTYEEVCSGKTAHNETVLVVYDPSTLPFEKLLKTFWETHDPTQGMRQGNDVGTQYRSGIYVSNDKQRRLAEDSKREYSAVLAAGGYQAITTEILTAGPFYYAEEYHQQYLAKNPDGYCGLGGTGISYPEEAYSLS